jgi:4a-hydroxytetrahydrobiopterin dehydratase
MQERQMRPCEKCGEGEEVRALSSDEVISLLNKVSGWSLTEGAIVREFLFRDFMTAIAFVNKVAALAEKENHHPDISVSYNNVRLMLFTHKVDGFSCKDFMLAAKIDRVIQDEDA